MKLRLAKSQPSSSASNALQQDRYLVKSNVDSKPVLYYSKQKEEDLKSILLNLCTSHPDAWQSDVSYYFYVEMGNYYYPIEDSTALKDKDVLIVTTEDDLDEKPRSFNLGALFASLKDGVQLKPHQEEGVQKMMQMEKLYNGGILADEMGLGKTLQLITMVLRLQPVENAQCMTLVVVPSISIAEQWGEEIRTKTRIGSLPYFIYENSSNNIYLQESVFRVVIVTYDRLRAEYRKLYWLSPSAGTSSPTTSDTPGNLFEMEWHRIVLDESHVISEGTMLQSATNELEGRYRWCITGTPLQNHLRDLYIIFNFLKIKLDSSKRRQVEYLREMLNKHMIRRKKTEVDQSETYIPQLEEKVVYLEFTKPERALYDYLERLFAKNILNKSKQSGFPRYYFIMYLRLKQACINHWTLLDKFPDLIPMAKTDEDLELLSAVMNSDEEYSNEKSYFDGPSEFEEAIDTIQSYYDQFGNFQDPIDLSELQRLRFLKHSTKIKWLAPFLHKLLRENKNDKIIVVSQFISVLKKIGEALKSGGIPFQTYHGELNNAERRQSLNAFNHTPKVRVLTMCLKSGNVGLNLQKANHMIFMDKWWNPTTMDQAVGRINRINQLKETFVYTVVVKDTIEETIIDSILRRKNELFKNVIDGGIEASSQSNREIIIID